MGIDLYDVDYDYDDEDDDDERKMGHFAIRGYSQVTMEERRREERRVESFLMVMVMMSRIVKTMSLCIWPIAYPWLIVSGCGMYVVCICIL